jgi:MFS family permease
MPPENASAPNRWAVLGVVSVAQLMVILDATIVTVALPSAQRALHFSTGNRQWVITAYALAFGSLLLLGGKLGDLFGRKWALIAGLAGFSGASAIGGVAQSFEVLVAARALQGVFAALLAPSALSLLAAAPARSGCCWAGCSRSTCRGAGACTSIS